MRDVEAMLMEQIDTLKERVRQLEELLMPLGVKVPVEWCLTSSEAKVFQCLAGRDMATKENIMFALYSDRPYSEEVEPKIVDVFICKLRRKVSGFGVQIDTIWGQGYALKDRTNYLPLPATATA